MARSSPSQKRRGGRKTMSAGQTEVRTNDRVACAERDGTAPLIEMMDIVKVYKTAAGDFPALNAITACFYRGDFGSVVGKSGSGKSTLANMITGIDHPTSGSVRIGDTYVHSLSENAMSVWRGVNLGIVFQF